MQNVLSRLVQSVGVTAIIYIAFQGLGSALETILNMVESFVQWYRFRGFDLAEEVAIVAGFIFFISSLIINNK